MSLRVALNQCILLCTLHLNRGRVTRRDLHFRQFWSWNESMLHAFSFFSVFYVIQTPFFVASCLIFVVSFSCHFSFAGLKSTARRIIANNMDIVSDSSFQADMCASFQHAVFQHIAHRTHRYMSISIAQVTIRPREECMSFD